MLAQWRRPCKFLARWLADVDSTAAAPHARYSFCDRTEDPQRNRPPVIFQLLLPIIALYDVVWSECVHERPTCQDQIFKLSPAAVRVKNTEAASLPAAHR